MENIGVNPWRFLVEGRHLKFGAGTPRALAALFHKSDSFLNLTHYLSCHFQMAESSSIYPAWPPEASIEQTKYLRSEINDWSQAHGLAVRSRPEWGLEKNVEEATCTTAPVTVFPSLVPRKQYDEAKMIQTSYNELYAKIASDVKWLSEVVNE